MIIKNSMKNIYLTKDKYTIVDDEDYKYLNQWKWRLHSKGYAYRNEKRIKNHTRKGILMHRQIMKLNSQKEIDHINRNKLDNRRENLRFATVQQNIFNRMNSFGKTSKRMGVSFNKNANMFVAYLNINNKKVFHKYFKKESDAIDARTNAEKEYFKEFAPI